MELRLSESQEELRALAREIAEREFKPRASRWDENEEWPEENLAVLAKTGFTGLAVPERYGGMGGGDMEAVLVLEQIGRVCLNTAVVCQLFVNGPPRAITTLGNDDQKERWLPGIASGECLFGIGMTEPDAGSDAMNMRSRVVRKGNEWRLDGYKNMVTGGHKAQAYFVVTRFPADDPARTLGAVLVPADTPGVSVSKVHKKMGLRGAAEAEIAFDDVVVPDEDVLLAGDERGDAMKRIMAQFNHERLGNAAMCTGVAGGALDESIRYAQQRVAGGKRIIEIQAIAHKLAEMSTKVEAARLMVWRAATTGDSSTGGHEPDPLAVAQAKWYANVVAQEVSNEAIQIHGGYGYTREFPVERMFRDVRGLAIGAGTIEVQKNLIARMLDRRNKT